MNFKVLPPRYTSGPYKGKFMKMSKDKSEKCDKCETLKKNQESGKIFAPPDYEWRGHRIIDMKMLAEGLWCKICDSPLSLKHCIEEKRDGVASLFKVKCTKCGRLRHLHSVQWKKDKPVIESGRTDKIVTRKSVAKNKGNLGYFPNELWELNREMFPNSQDYDGQATCSLWSVEVSYDAWPGVVPSDEDNEEIEENGGIGSEYAPEDPSDSDWAEKNVKPVLPKKSTDELLPRNEIFSCEYCSEQFTSNFSNRLHMKEKHEEFNNRICGWCKKKCCSDSSFRNHRRSHRAEAGCMCEACGKKCRNEKHLEFHKLDHLPDDLARKFSCTYCGKRYKTEAYVVKHEKTHTSDRPFICNECPKKFALKIRLEEHMQLHTGEFKFTCEICNARFTRKDNMTQHLKHNHRFVCPICNYTFTTAEDVKLHRNETHTKEEIAENETAGHASYYKYTDFQCDICHRFLASKQSLNFHIATHTGERKKRPASSKTKLLLSSKIPKLGELSSHIAQEPLHVNQNEEQRILEEASDKSSQHEETLAATYNLIRIVSDQ